MPWDTVTESMVYERFSAHSARSGQRQHRANWTCGDSDVDWGDSTSAVAEAEDSDEVDGGMLVGQDIEADAMAAFVRSMGVAGQAHVSAGDLEDEARIRLEDADEDDEEVGAMAKRSTQSWSWPMPCRRS